MWVQLHEFFSPHLALDFKISWDNHRNPKSNGPTIITLSWLSPNEWNSSALSHNLFKWMTHSQKRTLNNFPIGIPLKFHNKKHILLINESPETVLQWNWSAVSSKNNFSFSGPICILNPKRFFASKKLLEVKLPFKCNISFKISYQGCVLILMLVNNNQVPF